MKVFRRSSSSLVAFAIVTLLVPVLIACGSNPPATSTEPAANTNSAAAPAASDAPTAAAAAPAATSAGEATTGSDAAGAIPRFEQPVSIELFSRVNSPEVGTPPDDWFWIKAVKEALNVDVKVNFVTETSQYNEKLQTRAAANDLPDIFQIDQDSTMVQLANQGLLADWTPFLTEMPNFVTDRNVTALAPRGTLDGKQYGLVTKAGFPYKTITLVRKDWLDKLGLKEPKTLDEYLEVMKAFTEQDPDGNGQNDTYGFSMAVNPNSTGNFGLAQIDPIFGAFDALGIWRVENGQLVPIAGSQQQQDALQFINKMSDAGVLDPDWKAQKPEDFRLKWKAGKVGIFSEDWCAALCTQNYDSGFAKANPQGVLEIIDPPVGPGGQSAAGTYSTSGQMYGMSQKAVDAGKGEAVARLMEWINGPGYLLTVFGEEGPDKGYTLDANGKVVVNQTNVQDYVPLKQLTSWGLKGTDDEWAVRYQGKTKQGDGSTLDVFTDVLQRAAKLPKTDTTEFASLPPPPAEVTADYTRTANEGAFQFASGQQPLAEWDSYVQSLKTNGLDQWVEQASARAKEVGLLK